MMVFHMYILMDIFQLILMFHSDAEFSSVVKVLLQSVCNKSLDLFQGGGKLSSKIFIVPY